MTGIATSDPSPLASRRSIILAMTTILALVGGAAFPSIAAESDPVALDLETQLVDLVGLQPGGAVALTVHDGETSSSAVGFADAAGHPMTVDTGFRVGWFTMQYVAAMVLQLVDEGRVDLDATLATYLPDVPVGGDATIRELLTQKARLSNVMGELLLRYTEDPAHLWTSDEVIGLAAEVARDEGTRVDQLGVTEYVLLGKLVDELEDGLYDAFDRRIVEPLGLAGTSYLGSRLPTGLAAGWDPGFGFRGQMEIGGMDRIGGIRSTAPDMVRFLEALMAGEVVSSRLVAEVFSDAVGPITLGGFFLPEELGFPGRPLLGTAFGDVAGYSNALIMDPVTGDIAVVLTNNATVDPRPVVAAIVDSWDAERLIDR